jgi:signal transduction histidine kinase
MLDHTRCGGAPALGPAAFDVAAALRAVEALMSGTLSGHHRLRLNIPAGLPPACGNTAECEAMLINLVANARDAMPAGGEIGVTAAIAPPPSHPPHPRLPPGSYLRLSVRDTGSGMDAATLARAGELFFTTKPAGHGSGLGLAMARGFARRNGGALELTSTPGQGTTVTVWLPTLPPVGASVAA